MRNPRVDDLQGRPGQALRHDFPDQPLDRHRSDAEADQRQKVNAYEFLLERARRCARQRNRFPNMLNVDFYLQGDLFRVVETLNREGPGRRRCRAARRATVPPCEGRQQRYSAASSRWTRVVMASLGLLGLVSVVWLAPSHGGVGSIATALKRVVQPDRPYPAKEDCGKRSGSPTAARAWSPSR